MKKISINKRNFKDSNHGAAGVVVAILLIGLFFSGVTIVQTVYVPQWMEQKEAEHMDTVSNQFSQLKFAIDTLSVAAQANNQISSPITLGGKEIPFFSATRSYGELNIMPNGCKITIVDNYGESVSINLGSIIYSSTNGYYIDQSYIYENGALIISQSSGDILAVPPAFSVGESESLSFNIIKLTDIGDKTSTSGYGTYPLQTKFLDSDTEFINNVKEITLITSYKQAWYNFFNDTLKTSFLNYSISNTIDDDGIIITFHNSIVNLPELLVKTIEIECQISPGWIQ